MVVGLTVGDGDVVNPSGRGVVVRETGGDGCCAGAGAAVVLAGGADATGVTASAIADEPAGASYAARRAPQLVQTTASARALNTPQRPQRRPDVCPVDAGWPSWSLIPSSVWWHDSATGSGLVAGAD